MTQSRAPAVVVTADGSRTLASPIGEAYKSLHGALSEARSVYLEGSGVADRLARGWGADVLEVGFGTGLNFLVSATAAVESGAALRYRALELAPPSAATLRELRYAELLAPSRLPEALIAWRAGLGMSARAGWHAFEHDRVSLELFVGDALSSAWEAGDLPQVDAVYHDSFGPANAPGLWSGAFLARLARVLKPDGRLVSFCVAGAVRRALADEGLEVAKAPGPVGGKREVLVARRPAA
ncbi:MAG: tRNA (5-methylaminomethyl-2-thiouridine)(34)-methyltransferase MnmD [Trueperaceae bacterium]|nr:tRNA (5-methylaminomethyl-2-thiouridine)(34)-methyltransferase MnmD [Trueperaceae bacterium]MCO5173825.1 tRNA (5-methylaminomethyl-2-thiouridine)(34)-methyltransferase MnmD [Trueperaceae bacterium]